MNEVLFQPSKPSSPEFDPLVLLQHGTGSGPPVVCLPGAGASITSLMELAGALGEERTVYGLQPLGIEWSETPHTSVEDAAVCNLTAMRRAGLRRFHLIGHSHGGTVAFEMSLRLQDIGASPASLTLIDSRPPPLAGVVPAPLSDAQILAGFVDALRRTFDGRLILDEARYATTPANQALPLLRDAMVASGILSPRSHPRLLEGPFATYAVARRTVYRPTGTYAGPAHLALARDANLSVESDEVRQADYECRWRSFIPALVAWHGVGNHYSTLQAPYAGALVAWWEETSAHA